MFYASQVMQVSGLDRWSRDGLKAVLSRQRQGSSVLNGGEARQRQRARGRGEAD